MVAMLRVTVLCRAVLCCGQAGSAKSCWLDVDEFLLLQQKSNMLAA